MLFIKLPSYICIVNSAGFNAVYKRYSIINTMVFRFFFILIFFIFFSAKSFSQCCSAGSGSPIAGGASQGVLQERQIEFNTNYQHILTRKFLKGDTLTKSFLDKYYSNYGYFRTAYGLNERLTVSLECGYYFNKTQIGLDNIDTNESSGIGDLIFFPRYQLYNKTAENKKFEVTVGLGLKIPLGKYNDSLKRIEPFSGEVYYVPMPPAVQPTTGAHDIIFYTFIYRGFPLKNFRIFANGLFIKKGWNPNGEKFGNFASIGLFAGKTFFRKLGVTLQAKGEWIDKMKYNYFVYLMGRYNYDLEATGSKKVFVVPQVNFTITENLTIYALTEIPVYQYVTKTQIASQYLVTSGISYRFLNPKKVIEEKKQDL